ncbi:MAG: ABC transporter permease [Pleomorphochaeta sp.]
MNKDINKLLINKILFSQKSKNKLIRSGVLIILIVSLLIISTIFINSMSIGISNKFSLLVNGDIEVYTTNKLEDEFDFIYSSDLVSFNSALIYGKEGTSLISVKGVEKSYFNDLRLNALNLEKIENDTNLLSIIISNELATSLDLKIGDKAAIIFAKNEEKIRPKLVFIEGIYNSGYKEIDQSLCYFNLDDLIKLFDGDISVNREIILNDKVDLDDALIDLRINNYIARGWYELQPSVYNNLLVSTQSLLIVLVVIALLTGYFISSVSSDLITKDHNTIAINKLLGLRDKDIRFNYFFAIETFTVFSTFIGVLLGIILSKTFLSLIGNLPLSEIPALKWYLLDFDIIIPINDIIIISISLIIISMLSVYLSLIRIRKIEILDLLNHE